MPNEIFKKNIPILGICYGLQLIAKIHGGKIKSSGENSEEPSYLREKIAFDKKFY